MAFSVPDYCFADFSEITPNFLKNEGIEVRPHIYRKTSS